MPKVTIVRSREAVNMAIDYTVYVNGKKQGKLRRGKKLELDLPEGTHVFTARMEDYSSQDFSMTINKGQKPKLALGSFRGNSLLLPSIVAAFLAMYFVRQEYGVSWWYGAPVLAPLLYTAVHFHFLHRDRYLRFRKLN
jgi:hypothetical protein